MEDDPVRRPLEHLELRHWVLDLHHVHEAVDPHPPALVDEVVDCGRRGGTGAADGVGGLLEGHVDLYLADVHGLEVGDDEAVLPGLPDPLDDLHAVALQEGGPGLEEDVIVLRDALDDPQDAVDVGVVQGDLEVGWPPQPRGPESHEGVAGPVLVVHYLVKGRVGLQRPADGELGGTVVVLVDPALVLGLGVDEDADDDDPVVHDLSGDDAVLNGVGDGLGDGGLGGAEDLPCVLHVLDGDLGDDDGVGLWGKVGPDDRQ